MFQGHYARFIRFWIRIATTDRRAIAFLFLYCQFLDIANFLISGWTLLSLKLGTLRGRRRVWNLV